MNRKNKPGPEKQYDTVIILPIATQEKQEFKEYCRSKKIGMSEMIRVLIAEEQLRDGVENENR